VVVPIGRRRVRERKGGGSGSALPPLSLFLSL
jgi:hypothetical protein